MRVILLWLPKGIHLDPQRCVDIDYDAHVRETNAIGGGSRGGGLNEVEVLDCCHD